MADALDKAASKVSEPDPNGRRLIDDEAVAYRLGRSAARMEAALSAPSIFGRVALAQTMRDISPDLMDILGTASTLPYGTDGAADDGASEYVYRFAPLVGHLRRHAGGVPQHDRAIRAGPGQARLRAAGAEESLLTAERAMVAVVIGMSSP